MEFCYTQKGRLDVLPYAKEETEENVRGCMCAIVQVPAVDPSNKTPKESGSGVFWIIIILDFPEADIF